MKKCSVCKVEKELDSFARKGEGKQPHCKDCQKVKIREWYKANKQYQLDKVKVDKRKIRDELRELKKKPCTDCKREYPYYVMDWDHVSGDKVGNVGSMMYHGSRKRGLDEIAKCELVCANCHRERTHQRNETSP